MALKLISEPQYRIERPGYDKLVFTTGSPSYLVWPKAVAFAAQKGGVLESAPEGVAFRIEAEGQDGANFYQATRTAGAHFRDGNKRYAAFDDIADPEQNIILARVQEGYDAHSKNGKWQLSKNDKHIKALIKRAEKADRIRELTQSPLELSLEQVNGASEFGNALKPVLLDVAEPYAASLKSKGYTKGFLYDLTSRDLEALEIGDKVEVRPVGLGGVGYGDIYGVNAYSYFGDVGRARGVVHGEQKISTGNEGRRTVKSRK